MDGTAKDRLRNPVDEPMSVVVLQDEHVPRLHVGSIFHQTNKASSSFPELGGLTGKPNPNEGLVILHVRHLSRVNELSQLAERGGIEPQGLRPQPISSRCPSPSGITFHGGVRRSRSPNPFGPHSLSRRLQSPTGSHSISRHWRFSATLPHGAASRPTSHLQPWPGTTQGCRLRLAFIIFMER